MDELYRQWGRNIKAGRKAFDLDQAAFAKLLNVKAASVSRWENGKSCPTDYHKIRIAEVLHQDVRQLFPLTRSVMVA